MSALRRDLLERRWWVLVAVLVVGVVAVPLLLLTQAPASGARVDAPSGVVVPVPVPASARHPAAKPAPTLAGGLSRDPFISATPKLAAKPAAATRTPATSSTDASNPVLVAPTPAAANSSSSVSTSTPATGSGSTPSNNTVTGTTTTTTTTTTDPPSTVKVTTPPSTRSWTIYAVDLRLGKDPTARVRRNLARLTLLPTPKDPELMFIGVMAGGTQAVFALAAGVQHRGRGVCKPSHQVCSTIMLKAGQTELITVPTTAGEEQQLILSLIAVRSRVTESRSAALAAYKRESAAGQCDLNLAEPMSYGQSLGTLSAAAGGSCRHQSAAVPFPFVAQSQ